MKKLVWVVGLVGALSQGCVVNQTRVAKGSALLHASFPYAVAYEDEEKKSVLGDDWRLENYRVYRDQMSDQLTIERKDGYTTTYEFDFDDDDKGDAKQTLPSPDLIFVSTKTNARIEVTSLLLDKRYADKELRVLLNDIVDSASGSRSLFVGFGRGVAGSVEKRFASRLLESSKASLQGEEGLAATVERANVDQLQLNPNARWRRSRLFLVHAPFVHQVKESSFGTTTADNGAKFHKYRVLFLIEYTNSPEDFEAQYPDLLRLLNKLRFLNDDQLMELMGSSLAECVLDKNGKAELTVNITETGEARHETGTGWDRMCLNGVYDLFHFAATGEKRQVSHSYDFSQPLKPAWLAEGTYKEERAPAQPSTATKPTSPEGEPSDAAEPPGEEAKPAEAKKPEAPAGKPDDTAKATGDAAGAPQPSPASSPGTAH